MPLAEVTTSLQALRDNRCVVNRYRGVAPPDRRNMLFCRDFLRFPPTTPRRNRFLLDLATFIAVGMFDAPVTRARRSPGDALLPRSIDASSTRVARISES
jgi:hypothetical protein